VLRGRGAGLGQHGTGGLERGRQAEDARGPRPHADRHGDLVVLLDRLHVRDGRRQTETLLGVDVALRDGADQGIAGLRVGGVADEQRAAAHALGHAALGEHGRIGDLEQDHGRAVGRVLPVGYRQDLDRDDRDGVALQDGLEVAVEAAGTGARDRGLQVGE
jgi:hypothetical protein